MNPEENLPTVKVQTSSVLASPGKVLIVASAWRLGDQQLTRGFTASREFDRTGDELALAEHSMSVLRELIEGMRKDRMEDQKGEAPKA